MHTIGFLVNPIAGMGGAVGLKGTDGKRTLQEAIRKGAEPVSPKRALNFLQQLQRREEEIGLITAPKSMGADQARELKLRYETIGRIGSTTSAADTVRIARLMKKRKTDLIVFCGGDGTARDVWRAVGEDVPVLGVPAGVKVYSSVFAINPVVAAEAAVAFLKDQIPARKGEVVDVDEAAFRKHRLAVRLFGLLTIPDSEALVQGSKSATGASEDLELEAIANFIVEEIDPDTVFILGPGSTVGKIAEGLGVKKTLLGVDAVRGDGTVLGTDLDESGLLRLLDKGPVKVLVSPIGGQGFLFGRGNQQISPKVLRRVGVQNVVIAASRNKIERLRPRHLLIDSGDDEINGLFRGYVRVITGYREEMVVKVE